MSLLIEVQDKLSRKIRRAGDALRVWRLSTQRDIWPCLERKHLVVGCESSGTTPISHLLFRGRPARFLIEGEQRWVWDVYKSVYQGRSRVEAYPRLQLFDNFKVPGFAAILPQFLTAFPNTRVVYVVRDPRDVVVSAYKTWKVARRAALSEIGWVKHNWLGIAETDPVGRLAHRWRTYLEHSQQVPGVTYVRYEDFCADKVGFLARLAESLSLAVDLSAAAERCDRQASTADTRAYQPEGPGAWQKADWLTGRDIERIEQVCGMHMRRWNYL